MAIANSVLIGGATTNTTDIEILYTSPTNGNGTVITAFTATNPSMTDGVYSVYIVDTNATGNNEKIVASEVDLAAGESDNPPEVISHFIPAGGTIQVSTDVAGNIVFRASGYEISGS